MKLSREEKSWILVDCGNSAYSMAVTTALLPIMFGMFDNVRYSMDLGYFNSIASILVAVLSPVLGAAADYKDKKKRFFVFFTCLGVLATASLAFIPPSSGQWQLLILFFILSAIGFAGSNIFYDAFIVDVTSDERMDKISSLGFAFGYISSVIPFGISLALIFLLGMDKSIGYQIGFIITALWWGLLTFPMIKDVKQIHYVEPEQHPIKNSFKRLAETFKQIRQYNDGVDTIIKMVVPYATAVLGNHTLDTFSLLGILLIIQLIAFPCAIFYGNLAKRLSARTMIIIGIFTYIITCIAAFFLASLWHIFILGAMIGSAQGGIQALSRSYYAKIIPKEKSNEFFGFYNIFGKFSAIMGPTLMSLITAITGNARWSILGIIPLFLIGLVIFMILPKEQK